MTTALLAAAAGILVPAGVIVCVAGIRRAEPRQRSDRRGRRSTWRSYVASRRARLLVALSVGILVWALFSWPVAGLLAAATVIGLPVALGAGAKEQRRIDRIEAIEEWTRRLSDVLVAGAGLEQAVTTSVATAPEAIRREVSALSARLAARWPAEQALHAFADDMDDASADLVVSALILAARRRGPGLSRVLVSVADSVAEDVGARRRVEAERAKPRATARAVTLITLAVVAIGSLNTAYVAPYRSALGQIVLAAVAIGFAACLAWIHRLTISAPEPRFLGGTSNDALAARWSR
ncbi:type II secretion system F family protein [Actinotalea solisilvae]|uniref:type II secretion system F family protein n=1 Tax=Actinotalea solisilvae TaxID=2072922 RepID=UPI0018F17D8B|nr:type II secretion system F family protein [Actinotalea solisilvae]